MATVQSIFRGFLLFRDAKEVIGLTKTANVPQGAASNADLIPDPLRNTRLTSRAVADIVLSADTPSEEIGPAGNLIRFPAISGFFSLETE